MTSVDAVLLIGFIAAVLMNFCFYLLWRSEQSAHSDTAKYARDWHLRYSALMRRYGPEIQQMIDEDAAVAPSEGRS